MAVGATELGLEKLRDYSETRLLGEHVPYPIEAWPEGSQRHLSAESALYCRVFTEGLFGIRPTGFASFTATPRLPEKWNSMILRNIGGFNRTFDLRVTRSKPKSNELFVVVEIHDGPMITAIVDENEPVEFEIPYITMRW